MKDRWGREIDYLRLSVTPLCNLHCLYCRPEKETVAAPQGLSFEEMHRVLDCFCELGIRKIKITGGEPLLKEGIDDFLDSLTASHQFRSVTLTTNGSFMREHWPALSRLDSINVSLDSLDAGCYRRMTRGGDLGAVWEGIRTALDAGYRGLKVNSVLLGGINDAEILTLAELARKYPLSVRFIELMPMGEGSAFRRVPPEIVFDVIRKAYPGCRWTERHGNGPARYLEIPGFLGDIGFIDSVSHKSCAACNRIRMDAAGCIFPCLESSAHYSVRPYLEGRIPRAQFLEEIKEVIYHKPKENHFAQQALKKRNMNQIGG